MRKFLFVLIVCFGWFQNGLAQSVLTLESNATNDDGVLPVLYTCDGKNISPQLSFEGHHSKIQSYALVVTDPDAPGGNFYHWILYNIPKKTTGLAEGILVLPTGTMTVKNSFGHMRYDGPCPPEGTLHHYVFTLYGLDDLVKKPFPQSGNELEVWVQNHVVEKASFKVNYGRLRF